MPVYSKSGKQLPDGSWDTPSGNHPGGRPRRYETPDQMEIGIQEYFRASDEAKQPYTMAGLCYALGFEDRGALCAYEVLSEFTSTVKRARLKIEDQKNRLLLSGAPPAGAIFDLKNNHGWKDVQTVENIDTPRSGPELIASLRASIAELLPHLQAKDGKIIDITPRTKDDETH